MKLREPFFGLAGGHCDFLPLEQAMINVGFSYWQNASDKTKFLWAATTEQAQEKCRHYWINLKGWSYNSSVEYVEYHSSGTKTTLREWKGWQVPTYELAGIPAEDGGRL